LAVKIRGQLFSVIKIKQTMHRHRRNDELLHSIQQKPTICKLVPKIEEFVAKERCQALNVVQHCKRNLTKVKQVKSSGWV